VDASYQKSALDQISYPNHGSQLAEEYQELMHSATATTRQRAGKSPARAVLRAVAQECCEIARWETEGAAGEAAFDALKYISMRVVRKFENWRLKKAYIENCLHAEDTGESYARRAQLINEEIAKVDRDIALFRSGSVARPVSSDGEMLGSAELGACVADDPDQPVATDAASQLKAAVTTVERRLDAAILWIQETATKFEGMQEDVMRRAVALAKDAHAPCGHPNGLDVLHSLR